MSESGFCEMTLFLRALAHGIPEKTFCAARFDIAGGCTAPIMTGS
jgi:hypothetical protein